MQSTVLRPSSFAWRHPIVVKHRRVTRSQGLSGLHTIRAQSLRQWNTSVEIQLLPELPAEKHFLSLWTSMSLQSHDHHVDTILDFWFDDRYPVTRWFLKDDALDEEVKTKFSELVAKARTSELDSWCATPKGTLALIILLDQFSRNVYRSQPDSFTGDAKARNLTCIAIAKGFDRQVPLIQQIFMYLPFMHHEDLLGQIAGKSLCEGMIARCDMGTKELDFAKSATDSAQKHIDVILEFGRFPARNAAMGRKSTPEEEAFLEQHPMGIKR